MRNSSVFPLGEGRMVGKLWNLTKVTVRERPVLTVTPETSVQVRLPPLLPPPPPSLTPPLHNSQKSDINSKSVSPPFCPAGQRQVL